MSHPEGINARDVFYMISTVNDIVFLRNNIFNISMRTDVIHMVTILFIYTEWINTVVV